MDKITQLRNQTYNEAIDLLHTYGKCAVIRPTGFGKTGILTRIIDQYKNVLYIYPSTVIKDTVLNFYKNTHPKQSTIKNAQFMTYAKLARLTKKEMNDYKNIDIVITDECHLLGGQKINRKFKKLQELLPNTHWLGATATPDRMDLIDEISLFFDNRVVSKYTLHDAFKDGVLKKPYYCFCSYDKTPAPNEITPTKLQIDPTTRNPKDLLRSHLIEISNLHNIDTIIRTQCDQHINNTQYMKFIIFFSSFEHLHDQKNQVQNWFSNAYPKHDIKTMIISSEKTEYVKNTRKLNQHQTKKKTIELIFCCNMLNLGYHVDDLTGIVMYRGTESSIIFAQQLGRVLNSGHQNNCIVFDVVDNIHREAVYDVLGHKPKKTIVRNARYKQLEKQLNDPNAQPLTAAELTEFKQLHANFNQNTTHWWKYANTMTPDDLIATGYQATYKELIAKTVAEPYAMRCRQAWSRWIEDGGDPKDMSAIAILNQKAPYAIPLGPYCYSKQVTINATLNIMGVQ